MSDWPVGLSTGCFYQTSIFDCLESILHSGFGMIEICSFPAHLNYHDKDAVTHAAKRIRELGMEAYSFHAPFADDIDITTFDEQKREHACREIIQAAEAAAIMEVRYFVIHPGPEKGDFPHHERQQRTENAVRILNRVSERCRELGVGFVLENMLPHLFTGHVQDLLWILGALEATDTKICLDTGHAYLSGDFPTVAGKLLGHVSMLHACDNHGKYDDHLPPGYGKIPWWDLMQQLVQINFNGALIMEIAGNKDRETILEGAKRGRLYLRDLSRKISIPTPS